MSNEETEPKKKKKKTAEGTLDPMLVDPEGEARARFAGTTSDAGSRAEGTTYEDVNPDPDTNPDKASDAEGYEFPPGGDVDRATVDPGSGSGELISKPTVEDWVVLDGSNDAVPDVLDGRRAVILGVEPDQDLYTQDEWGEVTLRVRTRDDYGATLTIPTDAVKQLQVQGVNPNRT